MLKAFVFHALLSPPAPAWRTMNCVMAKLEPRSTCIHLVATLAHHLSVLPPETLPLTALFGPSLTLHDPLAVAGLFRATLVGVNGGCCVGGAGVLVGTVPPPPP